MRCIKCLVRILSFSSVSEVVTGLSLKPRPVVPRSRSNDASTSIESSSAPAGAATRKDLFDNAKKLVAWCTIDGRLSPNRPASAFENAVPEAKNYADRPKRPGRPPKDLGVSLRTTEGQDNLESVTVLGLRTCDGNPNCFSTTGDYELADRVQKGVDFLIAPWRPPPDDKDPLATVAAVVRAYPPGQSGIDGGGFAVKTETTSYLCVQFESLKKGFVDDVEFAVTGDEGNSVLVRSASRVGYTDFGVNAVRLNYLSSVLREKGWKIAEITPDTHRDYWLASDAAREATFDSS